MLAQLGQIPGLGAYHPSRAPLARVTRGDIPGLWDPRRVNQAWPEPVDNALMAYVPGLGNVDGNSLPAMTGLSVILAFGVGGLLTSTMLWGVSGLVKEKLTFKQSAKLGYGTTAGWMTLALALGGLAMGAARQKPSPFPAARQTPSPFPD